MAVDLAQLGLRQRWRTQCSDVVDDLLGPARADDHGAHARIPQCPGKRQLRKALTARSGDLVERPHARDVVLRQMRLAQRAASRAMDAGVLRDPMEVLVCQQSLCEGREGDHARAEFGGRREKVLLDPSVEHVVGRLVDGQRDLPLSKQCRHFAGLLGGIGRHAHIQRLALAHGLGKRRGGLLKRRVGVEAMRIEDVHVVEPHARQALVEACKHMLARAASRAIGSRPHVPAGLAGDDELVAMRLEILAHQPPEIDFRAAVGRPVVVRQIEMVDAVVEGGAQHLALGGDRRGVAEVVPQAEGDRGQHQAARAHLAVRHALVALGIGNVGHRKRVLGLSVASAAHLASTVFRRSCAHSSFVRPSGDGAPHQSAFHFTATFSLSGFVDQLARIFGSPTS